MMVSTNPPATPAFGDRACASMPPLKPGAPPNTLRALRATFFREFWPHAPFAVGFVVLWGLVAAFVCFTSFAREFENGNPGYGNILHSVSIRSLVLIGCALVGFCIGILQAWRDKSAATWAFVIHRPVSVWVLFAGRVLAGCSLYLIGAGLAVLALLVVAHSSRWMMPIHWRWMLPTIADALAGLVYYLAGMLVMQREGWWLGSRALPALNAILCSIIVTLVPAFWHAIVVIAIFLIVFGLAAQGAMASQGYRLQSVFAARASVALVLFIAMLFPLALLILMGLTVNFLLAETAAPAISGWNYRWQEYLVLPDGSLGIQRCDGPVEFHPSMENYYDYISWERIWPTQEKVDFRPHRQLSWQLPELFHYGPGLTSYRDLKWKVVNSSNPRSTDVVSGDWANATWIYISPPGIFYAYRGGPKVFLGGVGPNGFSETQANIAPFGTEPEEVSDGGAGTVRLTTARGKFEIDLVHRIVAKPMAFPDVPSLLQVVEVTPGDALPHASLLPDDVLLPKRFVALTNHELYVFSPSTGKVDLNMPLLHSPLLSSVRVGWFPEHHRWAVTYESLISDRNDREFDFFDESGHRQAHFKIPNASQTHWSYELSPEYKQYIATFRVACAIDGAIKAAGGLATVCIMDYLPSPSPTAADMNYSESAQGEMRGAGRFGAALLLSVSSIAAWLLARRYNLKRSWIWAAFGFGLGPMTLALIVFMHVLPSRVRCGGCGKRRVVSRRLCPHCGSAFAMPAANGTEIFSAQAGGSV